VRGEKPLRRRAIGRFSALAVLTAPCALANLGDMPGLRRGMAIGACALAWCAFLAAPVAASAQTPGTHDVLLVGNSNDGTVDVFDASTFLRLDTINVIPDGNTPQDPLQKLIYQPLTSKVGINYVQDIALSRDDKTLYVSRGYLGDVAAFDMTSPLHPELWRVQVHSLRADHLEISPDGKRLFVSAITSDVVEVIDVATHSIVGAIPAGDWPHTLAFSPDGSTLYSGSLGVQTLDTVTSQTPPTDGRHWLEAINPNTLQIERPPCQFSEGIRPFALTPDGKTMFLQLSYYNGIVKYDPIGCQTLATLDLPLAGPALTTQPHDYPNEAAQHGIVLSPDGQWLCAAGTIDNYVALVHLPEFASSNGIIKIIPVDQEPAYAVNSPDGQYCFVSDRGTKANDVSVISYATQSVVATMPTGLHPQVELAATVPSSIF
jgi:YVTN family beta-propeller protein